MKKILLSTVIAASTMFAASGADLYQPCVQCHGAKAEKVALGKSKILATLSVDEIVSTMKGYKDGSYGGQMKAIMLPQVQNLSDADIQAIAEHVQTIK